MELVFVKSIIVGLGASIPLGPIGVLCIQRTVNRGRLSGFLSGLGAASADTIFAALAIFGLAFVQQIINDQRALFYIIGGVILIVLGLNIALSNPIRQIRQRKKEKERYLEKFFSTFFLTLSNPGAVFLLLGLFALLQIDVDGSQKLSVGLILWGVFLGAAGWWFILTSLVDRFRRLFRLRQLMVINRITGIIIFILGGFSLVQGISALLVTYNLCCNI